LPPDQSFTLVDSTDVKFANVTNQAAYVHIPKVSFYLPNNLCICFYQNIFICISLQSTL